MTELTFFEPEAGRARGAAICRESDDEAFVLALSALPAMGPATLRRLLADTPARECWERVRSGRLEPGGLHRAARGSRRGAERWRDSASKWHPAEELEHVLERQIAVHVLGDASYPEVFLDEPTAPAVCFTMGIGPSPATLRATRRVALVGTRSSTHYGEEVAAEIAVGLSAAGITVVSGLAAGIDAAAHEGSLVGSVTAAPLAIVGGGVDVVYPAANRRLRSRLVEVGSLLSEAPPGAAPERWRFPLRNRLIAAAADVVVVVEAHRSGGAMHTVEAAVARGVTVAAVPGSVRSAASQGTNALLADGIAVVRDVDDVVALLSLCTAGRPALAADWRAARDVRHILSREGRPEPGPIATRVLAVLDEGTTALETVLRRTGLALGEASMAVEELVAAGRVARCPGGYERRPARPGA